MDSLKRQDIYEIAGEGHEPIVYDVGAHKGEFTWGVLRHSPHAMVYCFEPNPEMTQYIKQTRRAFSEHCPYFIYIMQVALMDKVGKQSLKIPTDVNEPGLATLGKPHRFNEFRQIDVDVLTLDSIWYGASKHRITFIKIDVEGAESLVIEGGRDAISSCRPSILFECAEINTVQFELGQDDAEIALRDLGYDYFVQVGPWDKLAMGRRR